MFPIYHVTPEIAPIIKVGGLGDVVHGLTTAFAKRGHPVHVVLPKYPGLTLPTLPRITFHLIENDALFNRERVYGYPDDKKRFTFFCEKAAELLESENASLVHLHDWPTAPIAAALPRAKTLLTLHNLAHQGGTALATGIASATLLNTVSPTYAKEILSAPLGCGLEQELRRRKKDLHGILNGIDTDLWNPETDPHLIQNYTAEAREKQGNRKALQKTFGMGAPHGPLVSVIARFDPQKGPELIAHAIGKTLSLGGQFILMGVPSSPAMETLFTHLQTTWRNHPDVHLFARFDEAIAHQTMAASDFTLIPSLFEPCGLTQMFAMRYGTLPIARKTGGLADTIRDDITGFLFDNPTQTALDGALKRAFSLSETKKISMVQRAMAEDFSWEKRANDYAKLYNKLFANKFDL